MFLSAGQIKAVTALAKQVKVQGVHRNDILCAFDIEGIVDSSMELEINGVTLQRVGGIVHRWPTVFPNGKFQHETLIGDGWSVSWDVVRSTPTGTNGARLYGKRANMIRDLTFLKLSGALDV